MEVPKGKACFLLGLFLFYFLLLNFRAMNGDDDDDDECRWVQCARDSLLGVG